MEKSRLLELAGVQLNELDEPGYDVNQMKDTISSLRMKLKKANVNTVGISDQTVLKFANAMKEITIESLECDEMLEEAGNNYMKYMKGCKDPIGSKEQKAYIKKYDKDKKY